MSSPSTFENVSLLRPGEERRLPWYHLVVTGLAGLLVAIALLAIFDVLTVPSAILLGFVLHLLFGYTYSRIREGRRWAMDRLMTLVVIGAFAIAMFPLFSLLWAVVGKGLVRVIAAAPTPFAFWTADMSGVIGGADAGGVFHATVGTLLITLWASIISIPVGLFTAIFLVEYAHHGWRRRLGQGVTFLVDVMTGIPSIVAGLFGLAVFIAFMPDQSVRMGIMGAVALSLLMIPTVVRSSEEMLRLVPMDLREAAYALGVPKWLTIVKVVLRTAIAGLSTGITLAIARVIGETAPLLLTVGMVTSVNWNMFDGRMATLPTFINQQYRAGSANCMSDTVTNPVNQEVYACSITTNIDRAWAAALTLIVIVMILNIIARLISHYFSPKLSR
ncbi:MULTISPECIES: phosphate ABC transporter permease PstA [Brachybacterium]|uniref:Phosphate transport system permease protein PstA n=1 Tax=Brachybacterium alimentarium TaxID=47845 RepID=A0A2A3YNS8_9MICO|nr:MULTISPECIES: phosphate ABC transporter permease PstA [Brachybacterium]PCC33027.1 phosphate ABC transporter, permease protein PstA [Brachybacterium alimentarium]PCC40899.1 phosphate ABC transporter, permease protein PstA [Brachybacterium alimentarium]RCS61053.1 phosphate ABC transporter permease PtsA [Brachybacterium sp. JB7]RCS67595.1 phosphate ABC transporter permease PtsA [Brachybacterium alimentarium]RCS69363.1 phosphate ABC transporter permease PtsA [Brachybacterium alimentarium]